MAFGGFGQSSEQPMAEINMIPLVDVMLVLLVVFIITAPVITHAVKVELPAASSTPSEQDEETVIVSIEADGQLIWKEEPVSWEQFVNRVQGLGRAQPELHLQADRSATYEQIAKVMAVARRHGVENIGFVTEPESR
ncbi:ExbD/TolR family protein [Thiohalophilus thiocyanatoxydans]|uniref:Outer membrane transport energization protein ExbD n=1 Tax=Thiohalophilus thiocyanatoxydans TaxID=381308 RepID=A0A4R8IIL0_9GAMM|nr:biopolymer transporter ExbD [Thiohalophilus thiocyanatoxydans]TDY00536.1 outer membrane transport energization protein ExbD [Thiohalophilus thiocyanatoxydans]